MSSTLLFIDADNQSPALAAPLARFLSSIGREATHAIVAGNSAGVRVGAWQQALIAALPGIDVQCHVAPLRKQSADVRLMFELARVFHGEPDPSTLILVLSRDDLLLAATECLVTSGHHAMVAVGHTSNGAPVFADLPVVVLPSPQTTMPSSQASIETDTSSAPTTPPNHAADAVEKRTVLAAVAKIKQSVVPNKQGGYAASAVGHVLAQLGHDKNQRAKIVNAIPNLKETGSGSDKHLIF